MYDTVNGLGFPALRACQKDGVRARSAAKFACIPERQTRISNLSETFPKPWIEIGDGVFLRVDVWLLVAHHCIIIKELKYRAEVGHMTTSLFFFSLSTS
jgi:hypothetical protein